MILFLSIFVLVFFSYLIGREVGRRRGFKNGINFADEIITAIVKVKKLADLKGENLETLTKEEFDRRVGEQFKIFNEKI